MKALLSSFIAFCVLSGLTFAFGQNHPTEEHDGKYNADLPGGIVYSDGTNAIFYDFQTKEKTSLTQHANGVAIRDVFAASESGETLVWLQNAKIWSMNLPKGTPRPFQIEIWGPIRKNSNTSTALDFQDIIWPRVVRNIAISPDESRVMFESVHKGMAWTYQKMTADAIPQGVGPLNPLLPLYEPRPASCIGIFALSKNYNRCSPPKDDPFAPRYGNVCEWPPVSTYRHRMGNEAPGHTSTTTGETGDSENRIYPRRAIAKSAFFPAFQKPEQWQKEHLMAFIFRLENGQWGPIEIRTVDSPLFGGGDGDHPDISLGQGTAMGLSEEFRYLYPRFFRDDSYGASTLAYTEKSFQAATAFHQARQWEIQIPSLSSCAGIAWTPKGDITILDEAGKLYRISREEIQRVISRSGVDKIPCPHGKNEFFVKSCRNVERVTPEVIGSDVYGSCPAWTSDEGFIYLGKDKCVYHCTKAGKTKLSEPIPGNRICYTSRSPLQSSNAIRSGKGEFAVRHSNELNNKTGLIKVGHIMLNTQGYSNIAIQSKDGTPRQSDYVGAVKFYIGKIGCQPPLEYCLTSETKFENIRDASECKFRIAGEKHEANLTDEVSVPEDVILLLRLDGRTVGIKTQRQKGTESAFSYEWRLVSDQPTAVEMEGGSSRPAKGGQRPRNTTAARIGSNADKDAKLPASKTAFSRPFVFQGMKLKWQRAQDGEIALALNYKDNSDIATFFVADGKAIKDLENPSCYKYESSVRNIDNKTKMVFQTKTLQMGEVVVVRYKDAYLALRPISVDKQIVTYKKAVLTE